MSAVSVRRVVDADDPQSWTWSVMAELQSADRTARQQAEMVLDTGTARTQLVLSQSVTGVVAEGRGDGTQRGALGEAQSETATLGHLRLGAVESSDLEIDLVTAARSGARSLLGLDVLGTRRFGFYPSAGKLVWDDQPVAEPQRLNRHASGHPQADLIWSSYRTRAVVDTGAGITVMDDSIARDHPELFTEHSTAPGIDATGSVVQTPTAMVADCQLHNMVLGAHRVAFTHLLEATAHLDEPLKVILGTPAIDQLDWWWDLPNDQWAARKR